MNQTCSMLLGALLTLVVACTGVQQNTDNLSTIDGKWSRNKGNIGLYRIENGALNEIAVSKVLPDSSFAFAMDNKEAAFYLIGTAGQLGIPYAKYAFYFKPGDRLNIAVSDTLFALVGDNTSENKAIEKWEQFMQAINLKAFKLGTSSTYVDFFPLLQEKLEAYKKYETGYTANDDFTKTFEEKRMLDIVAAALNFNNMPRSAHPQGEDMPDYYKNINISELTKTKAVLHHPWGMRLLGMAIMSETLKSFEGLTDQEKMEQMNPSVAMETNLPKIGDADVKAEYLLTQAKNIRSYDKFLEFNDKYASLLTSDDQRERMKAIQLAFEARIGQPATNFTFPDKDGKNVSLSDFKGKVVYIDFWATWCGPCKKEIPSLKKLEAELHGKDIVFLAVSIDAQKDHAKWKDFIAKEQMKGVQVFAGDKAEDIRQPYAIKGIPRFVLVGKDGKVIADDAPRPSSVEIKPLLLKALQ